MNYISSNFTVYIYIFDYNKNTTLKLFQSCSYRLMKLGTHTLFFFTDSWFCLSLAYFYICSTTATLLLLVADNAFY